MPRRIPPRISSATSRSELSARAAPYWTELQPRLRLGYRKGRTGAGVWLLREFLNGKYVRRRLGIADDLSPADGESILSYADASQLARGDDRPTVSRPGKFLVRAAFDAYVGGRKKPLDERELAIWRRFIEPDLGDADVNALTKLRLDRWLKAQVTQRGKRGQSEEGDEADKLRRAQYTSNRRWTLLLAILNSAFEADLVKSDAAWRKVQPFPNVDRPRKVSADVPQATELLRVCVDPLKGIAAGGLYTGGRLSELLRLVVADIGLVDGQVHIQQSKSGKERFVPLSAEGREFFAERIAGKAPDERIFEHMSRMDVSRAMRAASDAAGISPRLTHRDLRRTYGTLLLNAGVPIEVVQELLGHANVQITRRVYAHLLKKTVARHVRKHLPSFTGSSAKNSKRTRGVG